MCSFCQESVYWDDRVFHDVLWGVNIERESPNLFAAVVVTMGATQSSRYTIRGGGGGDGSPAVSPDATQQFHKHTDMERRRQRQVVHRANLRRKRPKAGKERQAKRSDNYQTFAKLQADAWLTRNQRATGAALPAPVLDNVGFRIAGEASDVAMMTGTEAEAEAEAHSKAYSESLTRKAAQGDPKAEAERLMVHWQQTGDLSDAQRSFIIEERKFDAQLPTVQDMEFGEQDDDRSVSAIGEPLPPFQRSEFGDDVMGDSDRGAAAAAAAAADAAADAATPLSLTQGSFTSGSSDTTVGVSPQRRHMDSLVSQFRGPAPEIRIRAWIERLGAWLPMTNVVPVLDAVLGMVNMGIGTPLPGWYVLGKGTAATVLHTSTSPAVAVKVTGAHQEHWFTVPHVNRRSSMSLQHECYMQKLAAAEKLAPQPLLQVSPRSSRRGVHALIMEQCPPEASLVFHLQKSWKLGGMRTLAHALHVMVVQVSNALRSLHTRARVVHGDCQPANIFVSVSGKAEASATFIDFGQAVQLPEEGVLEARVYEQLLRGALMFEALTFRAMLCRQLMALEDFPRQQAVALSNAAFSSITGWPRIDATGKQLSMEIWHREGDIDVAMGVDVHRSSARAETSASDLDIFLAYWWAQRRALRCPPGVVSKVGNFKVFVPFVE